MSDKIVTKKELAAASAAAHKKLIISAMDYIDIGEIDKAYNILAMVTGTFVERHRVEQE